MLTLWFNVFMQRFRSLLLIIAIGAAALAGVYLVNLTNSNNSINKSSASVYNIVGLSQVEDDILYTDKVVIDVNLQVLNTQLINSGTLELSYDKNLLDVQDIIMPSNVIALNQKIDTAEGKITLEIQSTTADGFKDILNLAKIIFDKKQSTGKFTNVTLLSSSTLGTPNTLDLQDKSLSISF